MHFGLRGIYLFIITTFCLLAIGGALYILATNYDSLIASVATATHKNGLEEKIRNGIFTRNRFVFLQKISWLVFVLAPFCFWLGIQHRLYVIQ
ncbi:MAG: hypothetical protein ABJB86_09875, partial [Bacteroidota bacterium]